LGAEYDAGLGAVYDAGFGAVDPPLGEPDGLLGRGTVVTEDVRPLGDPELPAP